MACFCFYHNRIQSSVDKSGLSRWMDHVPCNDWYVNAGGYSTCTCLVADNSFTLRDEWTINLSQEWLMLCSVNLARTHQGFCLLITFWLALLIATYVFRKCDGETLHVRLNSVEWLARCSCGCFSYQPLQCSSSDIRSTFQHHLSYFQREKRRITLFQNRFSWNVHQVQGALPHKWPRWLHLSFRQLLLSLQDYTS